MMWGLKPGKMRIWVIGSCLNLFLLCVHSSIALAQLAWEGEVTQSFLGAQVSTETNATALTSADTSLRSQTGLTVRGLRDRERFSVRGEAHLGASLNIDRFLPELDALSGGSGSGFGQGDDLLEGDLRLSAVVKPRVWLDVAISEKLGFSSTFGEKVNTLNPDSSQTSEVESDALADTPTEGLSAGTFNAFFLPQNRLTNEFSITGSVMPGLPARPVAAIRHHLFLPLGCSSADVAASNGNGEDYRNDRLSFYGLGARELSPVQAVSGGLRFTRETNRPLSCSDLSESESSGQRFYQLNPLLAWNLRLPLWSFGASLGGTVVWSGSGDEDRSGEEAEGSAQGAATIRPVGMVTGRREFKRGQLGAYGGIRMETLPGGASPTYNLLSGLSGRYQVRAELSVQAGLTLLRAFEIEGFTRGSDCSGGIRIAGVFASAEWQPTRWFRGHMSLNVSDHIQGSDDACTEPLEGSSGGTELSTRTLVSTLSAIASFQIGRGPSPNKRSQAGQSPEGGD